MIFRQVLHEDLGCASYLVADPATAVAAVVDPQWDIEPYLHLGRLRDVRIEHVLETHNHADHVSGHGRLARATGAALHVHRLAEAEYEHEAFEDGWQLRLGEVEIEALHTPGHRPEHTAFVLRDESRGSEPWAVLTGDSLFVGDVARPDLAIDKEDGAAGIFQSVHERLMSLPDQVEVWPGHVGGSMCGSAGIDHKSSSTIGFERQHNRALRFKTEAEFVADACATIGRRPPNTARIVSLNRGPLLEAIASPSPAAPLEIEEAISAGAIVIDARTNEQFDEAHIPGALSVSAYDTGFGTKVAEVVPADSRLVVVAASDGYELEAARLLASVGLAAESYLHGGMTAWRLEERPVESIEMIDPRGLESRMDAGEGLTVLDVRGPGEWADGHIPGSLHIPYQELAERIGELPSDQQLATICSGGKRSGLAASILQRAGRRAIHVAYGGVKSWGSGDRPLERG
jgi:glyoxylase-like metal-dependent hydrolase (beta-lactamase superfamily II)/rhodanese-related sulfurtransferase